VNLLSIIGKVGGGILRDMVPGAGAIIDTVNELLPDDKKLPASATGEQVGDAVASLPPEHRAAVMNKEFDVEITQIKEAHSTVRAMLESDAKNPQSTRPHIAKGSFYVVSFVICVVVLTWSYGVVKENENVVTAVMNGWPFVLAVIGPLVVLLHSYFGVLKQEHKQKLDAANGVATPSGVAGVVSALFKR
jgi:hypothetical protein